MPTIADQLQELINQKKSLVSNLNTKGVTASEDEKLNTLIPKVLEIPTSGGGIDTSDATASENDILLNKTAYVKGKKLTGTINSKPASTYTPSTEDQVISSGQYLSGNQTIKGDTNLIASNIKNGVNIFGVTGIHSGTSELTEATVTNGDIKSGKIAYGNNGEKIIGSMYTVDTEIIITPSIKDQILKAGFYNGITIQGDTNLVPANIKKGINIFGITGVYEGGGSTTSEQVLFECDATAEDTDIVEAYRGIVRVKNDTTYSDLTTYVYDSISAAKYTNTGNSLSGIYYKNSGDNNGIYFTTPVNIISNEVIVYIHGYVSPWISPLLNLNFIQADSVDDIETKINNSDFVYTKQIQISPAANSTYQNISSVRMYYEMDGINITGEHYLYIGIPATGGNEAVINKLIVINN